MWVYVLFVYKNFIIYYCFYLLKFYDNNQDSMFLLVIIVRLHIKTLKIICMCVYFCICKNERGKLNLLIFRNYDILMKC